MLDRTRIALIAVLAVGPHVLAGQGKTVSTTVAVPGSRMAAPEIVLKDSSNRMVRLSDYRGHVVLLDFWATKCGGCVEEIPSFIEIAGAYEVRGLRTLGVSEDIIYENLTSAADAWGQVRPFVRPSSLTISRFTESTTSPRCPSPTLSTGMVESRRPTLASSIEPTSKATSRGCSRRAADRRLLVCAGSRCQSIDSLEQLPSVAPTEASRSTAGRCRVRGGRLKSPQVDSLGLRHLCHQLTPRRTLGLATMVAVTAVRGFPRWSTALRSYCPRFVIRLSTTPSFRVQSATC